jgi:signal transduction histidine kinase
MTVFVPFVLAFVAAICVLIQQYRLARVRHRLTELERELIQRRDHEERCRILVQDALDARQRVEAKYAELQLHVKTLERTQALGNLATAIAHDLNNILTTIMSNCQVARTDLVTGHPAVGSIEKIEEVTRAADRMVQQVVTAAQNAAQSLQALSPSGTPVQSDTPAAPDSGNPT